MDGEKQLRGLCALGIGLWLMTSSPAASAADPWSRWAPAAADHFADPAIDAAVRTLEAGQVRKGLAALARRQAVVEKEAVGAFGGRSISVRRSAKPARQVLDRWATGPEAILEVGRDRLVWVPRLLQITAWGQATLGDADGLAETVCELLDRGPLTPADESVVRALAVASFASPLLEACVDELGPAKEGAR